MAAVCGDRATGSTVEPLRPGGVFLQDGSPGPPVGNAVTKLGNDVAGL